MKVEQGEHHLAWYFHVSCGHRVRRLVMPSFKGKPTDEQVWCAECWMQVQQAPDFESNRGDLVLQALATLKEKGLHMVTRDSVECQIVIAGWNMPETGRSYEQSWFVGTESEKLTWVEYWLRKLEGQGLVKSALDIRGWYKVKLWGLPVQPIAEQVPLLEGEG